MFYEFFHFFILHLAFSVRHWKKYQVTSNKYQDAESCTKYKVDSEARIEKQETRLMCVMLGDSNVLRIFPLLHSALSIQR